jgi:hypothetical protein
MTFGLLCMGLIALVFGLAVAFYGYKLFLILLPVWGFFFGFFLGAETIQVIFNVGFLSTVTSWVVGFLVGALFAVLSYLFYIFAVGVISFSLGYGLAVGILQWIGLDWGFLVWLIGLIVGVVAIVIVLRFNVQKFVIILASAVGGTGVIIYTFLALFGNLSPVEMALDPVRSAVSDSFWWLIFFLAVVIAGVVVQLRDTASFEAEAYNRLEGSTEAY